MTDYGSTQETQHIEEAITTGGSGRKAGLYTGN